jgi:hypothetical protein
MEDKLIMKDATKRSIFRWIHIVFAIPIIGYIYSPFEQIPNYAPATRFVFVPVIVLSGLWMWKGHVLRRLISNTPCKFSPPGWRLDGITIKRVTRKPAPGSSSLSFLALFSFSAVNCEAAVTRREMPPVGKNGFRFVGQPEVGQTS